jgi:nucleoside phosphorylase
MRKLPRAEPPEQACRALAGFIITEEDRRRKELLIADHADKAAPLPAETRSALDRLISDSFLPPERRRSAASDASAVPTVAAEAVDVLVVTPKPFELDAVIKAFDIDPEDQAGKRTLEHRVYYRTEVPNRNSPDRPLTVVVTMIGRQGNVRAGTRISHMLQWYRANAYFLCGVAAGREGEVECGDVLIPDQIIFFGPGRDREDEFEPRPDPATISEHIYLDLAQYRLGGSNFADRFARTAKTLSPADRKPGGRSVRPRLKIGEVALATSEQVLENGELLDRIAARFNEDIDGADMEAFGFVEAIQSAPWGIFRGVSDFGTHPHSKDWQPIAAIAAATALRDFLQDGYLPPELGEL